MIAAVQTSVTLSNATTFWWGALGALLSFVVVMILPEALKIARGEQSPAITVGRVIAALVIAVIFLAAGGLLSIAYANATEAKQALAYGLGMEGLLAGTLKGFAQP